jgi:hypothetical protein
MASSIANRWVIERREPRAGSQQVGSLDGDVAG